MGDRWRDSRVPRGAAYDSRFEQLEADGVDVHGEAALVDSYGPGAVLDAGCGTGRVAIELDRRGHAVVGVDVDETMLAAAQHKAPGLTWVHGDLADPELDFGRSFDVVVLAGNVLIFVATGSEAQVIANAARWLSTGGRLVTGYSLQPGGFGPDQLDQAARRVSLVLEDRWATWDRAPFSPHGSYAVSVHRLAPF